MSKDTEKILVSHSLENGLFVKIVDHSRLVAGDRWYLKITCITEGVFPKEKCQNLMNEEQYLAFADKYPDCRVSFEYHKERNFVDDRVKKEVLQDLVDQVADSNLVYMAKESFAENLLKTTVKEFVQEYAVRKEMGLLESDQEVEEPDDFSACFK